MLSGFASILETVVVAVLILGIGLLSYRVVVRQRSPGADDAPFGIIQASAFALVGLLLGFSFSLAVSRYDQRRDVTVNEANAIGTTILRIDLLDPAIARPMRALMRDYIQVRIDYAAAGKRTADRARPESRSAELQKKMWALTVAAARHSSDPRLVVLFVQAMNATIDASGLQAAALSAPIPVSVLVIVIMVILIATSLLGASFGRAGRFDPVAFALFAIMLALVVSSILDLDQPQAGFIKVPLEPLQSLQQLVGTPPPSLPLKP